MGVTSPSPEFAVRTELKPGDLGTIVRRHGLLYAREYGFDVTFEAYVAGPLAEFVLRRSDRERVWLAERGGDFAGCAAVVRATSREAQLRWFLVAPESRRGGLGAALLAAAVDFAAGAGYERMSLWTVSALESAARLYRKAGFRKVEEKPGAWGADVVEERYVLDFSPRPTS